MEKKKKKNSTAMQARKLVHKATGTSNLKEMMIVIAVMNFSSALNQKVVKINPFSDTPYIHVA